MKHARFAVSHAGRHVINMTGQRFGRLVVTSLSHIHPAYGGKWHCVCDCGNKTVVLAKNLRGGNTKSCGCLRAAPRKAVEAKAEVKIAKLVAHAKPEPITFKPLNVAENPYMVTGLPKGEALKLHATFASGYVKAKTEALPDINETDWFVAEVIRAVADGRMGWL
ncbi:hypothetical protein [Dyella telluris]|uniref:Uncharacterized protein n=1 Tax=Dyella telluris TaxID=2763498 RepID=A0A7G8Q4N5_9GAMM|nr:hypothetical protein [Dyella telluris]QNK01743.1 hypothetical protein H8F01_00755 [Dyella telluris]